MKKAFTLVELAIVLVIIGLLTAGVVGGKSLIESANRQKAISQITGYSTAFNAFQLEYNALPGDIRDAASYWPSDALNGDGNKKIDQYSNEPFQVWKHLNLSGLVPNTLSGVASTTNGTNPFEVGLNCPEVKDIANNGGYKVGIEISNAWSDSHPIIRGTAPIMSISMAPGNQGRLEYLGPSAKNSYYLDSKLDDGLPLQGRMMVYSGYSLGCYTGTTYDVGTTLIRGCTLWYDIGVRPN